MKYNRLRLHMRQAAALLSACVIAVGLFTGSGGSEVSADTLTDMQSKLEQLKKEQKTNENNLYATRDKASKQEEYQNTLIGQINLLDEKIVLQEQQIEILAENITELDSKIVVKTAEIEDGIERFENRLQAMYISGNNGNLASVLVGATSFYDLLNRVRVVQSVSEYDNKLIDDLNLQLEDLSLTKAEAEQAKLLQEQTKADLEADKEQINVLVRETEDTIAMLEEEAANYAARSAELEAQEIKIEKEIKAEIKRRADAAKVFVGGTFTWPCPDVHATSDVYGWRMLYGKKQFHKGIDITKPGCGGKDIVAANSGTVIIANTTYTAGYGYGKYVVIDHGGGYTTLYGHCNDVLVSVGQVVNKGDVIAKIGTTGDSTGNHCHFEIRVNGEHTDPMQYFKKTS